MFSMFMPHVNAQESVIFQDDFESYAVGTFPSSGEWQIVWNGLGDQYQVITQAYCHSPTKSLQLTGQDHWSSVTKHDFSSSSDVIGYEGYIMTTSVPNNGSIGFFNRPIDTWGRFYATVGFSLGNLVSGSTILQSITPYTWYKVRVILDKNTSLYDVWINGALAAQNLVEPNDPHEILSMEVSTGWFTGAPVYFDDVKVFEASETPSPSGLVGYWKFDEGSGTYATDSSGSGNTGTLTNGPAWVDGKFGKALSFDGIDDYVQVPQSNSLDVTAEVTVEAWVYPRAYVSSEGDNSHIVSRCATNGGSVYVLMTYSSTSTKAGYAVNQMPFHHASSADLPLNTWTHLTMTYDGSSVKLYINGQFDSSYAQSGPIETTSNWLAIGCKPPASDYPPPIGRIYAFFNGMIDEVRIYNRALSQQEIQTDMEGPIAEWGSLTASPSLQKVVPGGGTSFTISVDSPTISANLDFSISISGVNGYFVPKTIGGTTGLSASSLFISTSTSTTCGVHTIVITATPNSDDPTLTPISKQVTLEVMGGVTIAVMDACSDNKPIIGAKVAVGSLSRVTGASGILSFPSLGTGYYNVTISAKGYSGDVFTNNECPRVYKNQYLEVGKTFTGYLFPLRYTLTINVRDQYGNPVDGASGDIYDSNGHIYGAFATPSWGSLTMQNLEAATGLTMIVQKYGYETKTLTFDITSDVTLNIVLNDLGVATTRLTVHVEHASTGVAISGVTVQVAGQTGTTDRIGNAYFSALQFKEYIVTVSKAGYATAYARITISRSSPTPTIKVNLTPEVFGLFVHIQDSFGSPISGATVTIPSVPGKFTDNGGDAVFTGLKSGTYTVTASKSGYGSASTVATVGTSNAWVTITLQAAAMPDFTIEVEESFQKTSPGFSVSYNIKLTSINDFNQQVDLSITTFPRPDHVFSPSSSVQLSPGSSTDITLTINTQSSDVGEHQYSIECSYLGSPRSIVHSCTVTLVVSDFEYNIKISRSRSDGNYYLFEDATFYVIITDASSLNPVFIDPFSFNAQFDGKSCTDKVERDGIGHYSYTTEEFNSTDVGFHFFTFTCQTPGGSSFIASDTISVKLHKEILKLVFSEDEQYFPVDGLFYDDQNVSNNKANYQIGTKPSSGVKTYFKVSTHDDDPDIGSDEYVVQYWIYYAYNDYKLLGVIPDEHEHDFESITLWINKPTSQNCPSRIAQMILSQHFWINDYIDQQFKNPDEILIAVEKGGHGMLLLKELGSNYALFEKPWTATVSPEVILQGKFSSTSSPIYALIPAYDVTIETPTQGFYDPTQLKTGLSYDNLFPMVLNPTNLKPSDLPAGFAIVPFTVCAKLAVMAFGDAFEGPIRLKSNEPYVVPTIVIEGFNEPILLYITAPWKRAEFVKPTLQCKKFSFLDIYFFNKLLKAYFEVGFGCVYGLRRILGDATRLGGVITIISDPINITVVDSAGRVLGNYEGSLVNEVPGSSIYFASDWLSVFFITGADDCYTFILSSDSTSEYTIRLIMAYYNSTITFGADGIPIEPNSTHIYQIDWDALATGEAGTTLLVDQFGSGNYQTLHVGTELTVEQFSNLIGLSYLPPKTIFAVTEPKIITEDAIFVTPATQFILSPISERRYQQSDVFLTSVTSTDIAGTFYRIFNGVYDSGWLNYTEPFCLYGLEEGTYTIEYYSIDKLGNNETVNDIRIILQGAPLPTTYSLTITTTVGGTTDPTPGTYTYVTNQTVQITAIPDIGYLFDYWELDSVNIGSANPYTVLMDANHTLRAVFLPVAPPLSTSISPLSDSILVGQSVTFTSTVSGGYTPYSYQWYLNGAPVSGATSASWTFTPATSGIYYVHLKVTDAKGNTAQSETARITVAVVPVGGYSFPIQVPKKAEPVLPYIALMAILTAIFIKIKPKTRRKR
jgi:hypothetical protein